MSHKTIDLELGDSVTLDLDDHCLWYILSAKGKALGLNDTSPSGKGKRNFKYDLPGLTWRTQSQDISNSEGQAVIGDGLLSARSQNFVLEVVAPDPKTFAAKIDSFTAFLDRSNGPFYLWNNFLDRIAHIERSTIAFSQTDEGMEHYVVKMTLSILLFKALYESQNFFQEIHSQDSGLFHSQTGAAHIEQFSVINAGVYPVRPTVIYTAFGVPVSFTTTNLTNNTGHQFLDLAFTDGAIVTIDGRLGKITILPAGESVPTDDSAQLIQGGYLTLDPGENLIEVTTNADFSIPDFYWKEKYAV